LELQELRGHAPARLTRNSLSQSCIQVVKPENQQQGRSSNNGWSRSSCGSASEFKAAEGGLA
jgi:hypothetical protein